MSDINLSSILSDGMVIQRGNKTKVCGRSNKSKKIVVEFLNERYEALVDEDGKWQVQLNNLEAGGPYEMIISGEEEIRIRDILIGDVWLCSGQSNMELPIERVMELYESEVTAYSNNNIRQFLASKNYNLKGKQEDIDYGAWKTVAKENVLEFSSVGYFFAKELYNRYKVPIGLISTAVGGTPIESWISEESLKDFHRFYDLIEKNKDTNYVVTQQKEDNDRVNSWFVERDLKDEGINKWNLEELDDSNWEEYVIPGMWRDTVLDKLNGTVWFRKEVYLPKNLSTSEANLYLGNILDADEAYVNGILVGRTEYRYPPRKYLVNKGILKEGRNVIALRITSCTSIGGFIEDKPYKLVFDNEEIQLSGGWKYKIGCEMPANFDITRFEYMPTGFYNSIIYPLRNYAISGVIWYQGESNTGYPDDYEDLFEVLLKEWRRNWNIGEFPFLYVQLANYSDPGNPSKDIQWARLRESQKRSLKNINTGMAVTIDIGENNELHPFNKKEVGRRLALLAINKYYGEDIVCNGPLYKSMEVNENKMKLYFNSDKSELLNIRGDLNNFEICGEGNIYYKASASIKEDYIEVWSNKVNNPKYVRYAFKNGLRDINLYNKEGLPASPFTTEEYY